MISFARSASLAAAAVLLCLSGPAGAQDGAVSPSVIPAPLSATAEAGAFQLSDRGRLAARRDAMRERCAAFARDHDLAFTG